MRGLFVFVVLIATLVSPGTAQLSFGPEFHLSQYEGTEGETIVVRLSARVLTIPQVPPFNGSIEVDITAEDLPGGNAVFGSDYIVNDQNIESRTFTVTFQSKQANSTENGIQLADDSIVEGSEAFRLRIVAARFFGEAQRFFVAPPGLSNTVADVTIEDDDFVAVSWIISEPIEVREGEGVRLELFAKALGLYASPIEIGVVCAEVIATGVPPAFPDRDFEVLSGSTLEFTDVETLRSNSSNNLTLLIRDDVIAEPCESFICTLQGGAVDRVRGVEPNRVTVRICDDDELIVRWATDVYIFDENQVAATVQLVTDSIFEMVNVSIQGFPRQIPDGNPNRIGSLVVPGPPGFFFDASIERAFVTVPTTLFGERIFGNAQVTQSGRSDVENTINDFLFTPNSNSSFENFTIVDDDVLEYNEIFMAEFNFGPEIANNWNARKGNPSVAFIQIRDNDNVSVNFNENSYTVAESDGQVSVSLRIDGRFFVPVWAIVDISEGTATDPEDYSSTGRYNVTFRQTVFTDGDVPANTALSSPILISIKNDSIFEGVEYFQARIVETSDEFRVRIGQDTVNITITDNVTVRYEKELYSVDEEAGSVTLALVLEGEASVPVTVSVRTLDLQNSSYGDAATASDDYIPKDPFDITFELGSRRVLFNVTIVDDGLPENSEFFNADIVSAGPAGVIIGEPRQPVIEILDNFDGVTVRYEEELYTVDEEAGYVTLALVLERNVSVPVTVTVRTLDLLNSSIGDAATASDDYIPRGPFNITFQPGSRRELFNVTIVDDGIPESSEYFNADIVSAGPAGVIIGEPRQPLIEILDRDEAVAISLNRTAYSIVENEQLVTVTLTLNDTYREDIVVNVTVGELLAVPELERAQAGVDFSTAGFPRQVTIPAGQTTVQFNISVIDELIVERDEHFQVYFTYSGSQPGVEVNEDFDGARITIRNDDALIVRFQNDSYSVREDAGSLLYRVIANGTASFGYNVTITGADGSATCGSDYHEPVDDSSGTDPPVMSCSYFLTITIPAGSSAGDGVVAIINDAIYEGPENFFLNLSVAQTFQDYGINEGSPLRATVEIEDEDEVVAISLNETAYSIFENEQVVTVTLTLNDTYHEDIVVNVAVGELLGIPDLERAQAGVDFFTAGFPRQVTIPAGQTSVQFNIPVIDELIVERDEQFQVSFTYSGGQPGVVVRPSFDEARITIRNDDALRVMFQNDSYSVREDAGSLLYRVTATSTASFDYQVVITGEDGSATCGSDYHEPIDDSSGTDPPVMSCSYSLTITIPAGSSAGDGVVAIINDTIYEGPENFFLNLSVAQTFQDDGINEGSPLRATVEIEDDDELRVLFDPDAYRVPEGENEVLVLKTDNEFAVPFTIDVRLEDGTAVAPGDYEDRSYQVVFNVTTQTGTLVVHTETDNIIENDEDFTAVLSVPAGLPRVFEGTPSEATVTILDQTTAEVYFDPATYNVTEGQPADLILRLTRDVDPSVTINVMVQTMDGSAKDGADYNGSLYTATFNGSSTTSVPVPTLTDDVLEGLEYFTGVIQVPSETATNYRVTAGSPDTAMVNIIDATIAGVFFDPDVYMVNEGDNVTLILKTNVTVNKRFSVLVNTYDESANSPADYQGGEGRAIFEIGSNMATVVYSTVNDSIREGIESFIANLTVLPEMTAMGIVPGMPDSVTVNIIDDEVLVCMLVRTMHEVSEDMGPLVAMVMCSIPSDEPFTLIVQTSDDTAVDGEDYTGGDYSVFFPAGSTKESFSIPITDDDIFELDETFFLTLVIPQPAQDIGVMRGVPFIATVTIINDEPTVTIDIERRVIDVIENQTFVEVCLVKSGPSSLPVMALVNADEFTDNVGSPVTIDATSEVDFEPDVPEIILAPSETRNCTNVTIIDDKIVERMEPFEVIITFPPGQPALQIGEIVPNATQINGTINIIDDDVITVEFEQAMYMVNESEGMVDVTVIASGRTSFEYTFTVTPMDRTATNNFDYTYSTDTYPFGPTDENEPIPSLVISIPIINDGDNEFDEDFKLILEVSADGEAANVTEGPISMTVVLIKDDDDVTVTFSPQNYTVTEGDPAPLMIILDKPAAKDITVTVATMDITATDTDDYIGGSFDVSIPAGSVKVTLNVSTLQDNIVELPEYFKATLSLPGAPEGCVVGTPDMSYITIIDDTPMIPVWFNPANYSVKEGVDGNAVITLEAGDHNFDFTVIVNSQDGTAFNGSDYTGGPFEVTFPAGVNMVSFDVPILDDAIAECAKLFNLDLDIPAAAAGMGVIRGSPDTATVHIMDDDVEELRLSIENADYMVKENVGSFVAAVIASGPADFEYTVTVETSDDTAVDGDDFVSQQYTLTFPAGQTRAEFTVVITDDNVIEAMESFQLLLSIPQNLTSKGVQVGPNSAATVTIMDNDVQVKFSQSSVATTEEEGRVLVTVEAMGDLSSDFSIIVMAINGSAVEPFDFTGNMWPVDFLANQASASFEISIVQDNLPETREEFSLKIVIENPYDERVTVGDPSELTVVITDRKNDTVRGDPLFSIPLPSKYTDHTELQSIQLCFEIHGEAGKHYNLISDACTSVSAQYKQGENDAGLNVISNIGVKAQESSGSCHEIEVDLVGCSAQLDGTLLNTSVTVNGISIMIRRQRVRVSVPNCASSTRLTMWMMCMRRNNEDMLELVVARGDGLDPTAHGLIGQFWNIPVTITSYTGPYGDGTAVASDRIYSVTVAYPNATERTFIADYGKKDWLDGRPCLYAGNHNGGPIGEVKDSGSVIQGKYSNYEVADLFATNYTFSKFKANC